MGAGQYRVYILDEAHGLTKQSQDLLLDVLEDTPETTVFILCSTAPHGIQDTLRSRCHGYEMRELDYDNTVILIERLLKRVGSDLPADRLADSLQEKGIHSPRLIAQAVEKYYTGQLPDEAANVDVVANVDVLPLTRAIIKGDWKDASAYLALAQPVNARGIRIGVISYLRAILLESPDMSDRTKAVASSISALANMQNAEDLVIASALAAECYRLCVIFSGYKH
jgi:DNA polymerase III gamma/tau subunit